MRNDLRKQRLELRLSQSALARLSKVPRIRICLHELGDRPLSNVELGPVRLALQAEVVRIRRVAASLAD